MLMPLLSSPAMSWLLAALLVANLGHTKPKPTLIDPNATAETRALYHNLHRLSRHHILFGHQYATAYGHGWSGEPNRSDVKSVSGSHPAVIGIDFDGLSGQPPHVIEKNKESLRKQLVETYNRGGITTVSWHFSNPVTPETGFYWNDSTSAAAVPRLIPGGTHHQQYKAILQTIGALALSAKGRDGNLVPLIFRPYHEFDGGWFWWGKPHCSRDEFMALWRFTISYLRDSLHVHTFIYAFSPDCLFKTEAEFLERYPGDEWVDLVGMDNYADFGHHEQCSFSAGVQKLKIVAGYAQKAGKLAALTETGLESIPDSNWWTGTLLKALKMTHLPIAYVLVWRNAPHSATHFYAPFPGQGSVSDFMKFYQDPATLFELDLPALYRRRRFNPF